MQGTGTAADTTERRRVEAVIEALAGIHHHGEGFADLAHDARNMVTALSLYCDLLEQPGVLASPHRHYASELRLVAEGSRRLVEKLSLVNAGEGARPAPAPPSTARQGRLFDDGSPGEGMPDGDGELVRDIGEELLASRNLLSALAGPSIQVTAMADGAAWGVAMTGENLIRVLVNLVRNAAESIRIGGTDQGTNGGTIELTLRETRDEEGAVRSMVLSVEDSGPGIPPEFLERVFDRGFTTRAEPHGRSRGLGLSITRSIVEGAGGSIRAENRAEGGARFVMELPVAGEQGPRDRGTEGTRD